MSFSQFKETDSYLISEKHCSCIEFVLAGLYAGERISRSQKHGRITYEVR